MIADAFFISYIAAIAQYRCLSEPPTLAEGKDGLCRLFL